MLPSKRFKSYSRSPSGLQRRFGVKHDKYEPCRGADVYKNGNGILGVGILKMMPCSAAHPHIENI